MKLYVMRHGPAEDFAPSGRDADRALTASGRDRVRDVAKLLVKSDEAPRVLISSPLVRALQTAEIVAGEIGIDHVETSRDLAPGGDAYAFARDLAKSDRKRVMIVGHEPDLSVLVGAFVGGFARDMLKAMVVGILLREAEPARLRFVLDPKALRVEREDDKSV
jgi:phosphohistidine phosphatase